MAHTPKPWTNHSFTVQGAKGQIIADVCVQQPPHGARIKPSEFEANACLIAAAPELLEALKRVRQAFYVDGSAKALMAAFDGTKELVAKAEGR